MTSFIVPEGATPINDISGLKMDWVKTLLQLNAVEGENIYLAMKKHILRQRRPVHTWFRVSTLKKIHHDMFCDVWDWAGVYRKSNTNIGVRPYKIFTEVQQLCDDVHFWLEQDAEMSYIEQAARIHHRLVLTHAFENGNGRHARLVADMFLKSNQQPYPHWPNELSGEGNSRKTYISALKEADQGSFEALMNYMLTCSSL
jgi:Fic-DOC domain mobile mystery protein B